MVILKVLLKVLNFTVKGVCIQQTATNCGFGLQTLLALATIAKSNIRYK